MSQRFILIKVRYETYMCPSHIFYHKVQKNKSQNTSSKSSRWVLPVGGVFKVNVDVSISKSKEKPGFNCAICDSNSEIIGFKLMLHSFSSLAIEFLAI